MQSTELVRHDAPFEHRWKQPRAKRKVVRGPAHRPLPDRSKPDGVRVPVVPVVADGSARAGFPRSLVRAVMKAYECSREDALVALEAQMELVGRRMIRDARLRRERYEQAAKMARKDAEPVSWLSWRAPDEGSSK